jgi:hypothetical protein
MEKKAGAHRCRVLDFLSHFLISSFDSPTHMLGSEQWLYANRGLYIDAESQVAAGC